MFIPDIFIRGMDAIRYSSAGVEFIVLVDYLYTDEAYEQLQFAIDAYDDGHYETRKEAIDEYMKQIKCAYMVFYKNETEAFGTLQTRLWDNFSKEVTLQCPIVKTLET